MKCFTPVSTALILAASLLAAVDALSIQSSDIVTSSSADSFQSLERTWTVSSAEQLRRLVVQIPGNVFVEYDPTLETSASTSDVVAKIVVRGDSTDLLDVFEVVSHDAGRHDSAIHHDSVKVHLKNTDADVHGHVFTQIYVASKRALYDLSAAITHDIVVGEDVLASNDAAASLKLATAGAGSIFVATTEAFDIDALKIVTEGSGSVQFSAASLRVTDATQLTIAGSGDIALVAAHEVRGETLRTAISGTGDVFVQADNVNVHDLVSSIAGSGDVTLSKNGTCTTHKVSIAGSGSVAAGAIKCHDTRVSIVGSGDAIVQSTESLDVSVIATGAVQYVNARPKVVKESSVFSHHEYVTPATTNAVKTYTAAPIPPRATMRVDMSLRERTHSDDPSASINVKPTNDDEAIANVAPALSFAGFAAPNGSIAGSSGSNVVPVVGVVGVALAAVGAFVRKIRQQREREKYAPLV